MNIVFCGGGTVGHISPAIAIAEKVRKRHPHASISFIGRRGGAENEIILKNGYSLYEINVSGLIRKPTLKNVKVIKNVFTAELRAKEILKKISPDAVIGTGGYVCFPVLRAAKRLGIFTAIHESNAVLGLSSKMISRKCDVIFLGANINIERENALYTGNPVREDFFRTTKSEARRILHIPRDVFFIISVGGSIGAEKLNKASLEMMDSFSSKRDDVFHYHSVGKRYFEIIKATFPELCSGINGCSVFDFIDNMPLCLSAADLVISRAGAMTLSEIAATGSASILIPSPNVTADHQTRNALYFVENGASVLINETELSSGVLTDTVSSLIENREKLRLMSQNALRLASRNSAEKIVKIIESRATKP